MQMIIRSLSTLLKMNLVLAVVLHAVDVLDHALQEILQDLV